MIDLLAVEAGAALRFHGFFRLYAPAQDEIAFFGAQHDEGVRVAGGEAHPRYR